MESENHENEVAQENARDAETRNEGTRHEMTQDVETRDVEKIQVLPMVALRDTVIFHEMIVPLQVGRDRSVKALDRAVRASSPVALVTQRSSETEEVNSVDELYGVGTLAKIAQVIRLQDGTIRAIVQGQKRIRLLDLLQVEPHLEARVEAIDDAHSKTLEVEALMASVQGQIEQYVTSGASVPPEVAIAARNITDAGLLADMVAYSPEMSTELRQQLLETIDVPDRLRLVSQFLAKQIEVLELKGKIQSEVKSEMDKTQREYILREQMKAIQKELGDDDPAVVSEFLLDRLHLLAQDVLALGLVHLGLDLALDLALELQHLDLLGQELADQAEPIRHVDRLEQLLAQLGAHLRAVGHHVGQQAGIGDIASGDRDLGRNRGPGRHVLLDLSLDGSHQGLDLQGLRMGVVDCLDARLEMWLDLQQVEQPDALLSLHDGADGAVLQANDLGDLGQRADAVQLVDAVHLFGLGAALRDQRHRGAGTHRAIQRLDA